jgi:4a-hydroxytetrahydrobiopterin dehydratase
MGAIAEREGHHPDFHLTNYRDVTIEIFTHKLGGLTMNDFVLAKHLTDEVSVDYSPKWLKAHPEAQRTCKGPNM